MRTKGFSLLLAVSIMVSIAAAGPAAGTASWTVSLQPGGNPTSIQDLEWVAPGQMWAVGGLANATSYDVPTAWHLVHGTWTTTTIPVDLTAQWGYLTAITSVSPNEAWAVGYTVSQSRGDTLPLMAHWTGSSWSVVSEPWVNVGGSGYFSTITAVSATDVWAFGVDHNLSPTGMAWAFNGSVWSRQALPVHNPACRSINDIRPTSSVATVDGLYVSMNCQTSTFQLAGTVEHLVRRWVPVLKLEGRQAVFGLGADPSGTVWAAGAVGNGQESQGASWSGGPNGMTRSPGSGIVGSVLYAVSANASKVALVGERSSPQGPQPLLIVGDGTSFSDVAVPYDRMLSSVAVTPGGLLMVAGPLFGGWLGGDDPHAEVLTRGGGS
jgi:hypothetical protein